VLGTLGYLSPEQARGETVDGRSDIFSLGCVLCEALCGRRAFGGQTAQDLIAAVLRDEPAAPATLRPDVPPGLARVVSRCLAKEREARFQSASDLAFALRSLAPGSGPQVGLTAPASRRPRPLGLLLALSALGAGLVAGYALRTPHEVEEPMVLALTPGTSREASPAISPDGKFVAYLASEQGRTDVWVKFVGGGPAVNLTAGSSLQIQSEATIGGLEISPDGSAIAVQGEPLLSQLELRTTVQTIAFSWDGRRLAVGSSPGSAQASIDIVDLEAGATREVLRLPPFTGLRGIGWSADDRRLVYGLVQHESRILLFDGLEGR
jgi:hypothetical protein